MINANNFIEMSKVQLRQRKHSICGHTGENKRYAAGLALFPSNLAFSKEFPRKQLTAVLHFVNFSIIC